MAQYKKTPSQLIKQYMENNKYFIGDDLIEFLKDVDIYFEREIKNAYNSGDGDNHRRDCNSYYNIIFTETELNQPL